MARAVQKTKESEITEQDSLLLTRNLLRIAIFNISYIRGLFPENYFNDKSVPALGIKIKKLLPIDADSRRLIDWMEKGVYDALQKKYLKTLLFCICESPEGPMIEEYAFSFTYSSSDNEEVSMNVSRKGNKKQGTAFKTNSAEVTPDQMRSSACKMIRTLLQLMRTLDEIPEERTILMKLHYYEDVTPEDYEPPFFRSCSESESNNTWTRDPFKTEVGNVNSKHLVLALKVKSVLDPCGDENDGTPDGAGINLEEQAVQHDDMSSDSEVDLSRENQYILAPTGGRGKVEDNSTVNEDNTQDAELEEESTAQIRNWISSRHIDTVDLVDILTNFPNISMALTEEIVGNLMKEGLLSNIGRDSYKINIEKCVNSSVKEEVDMPIDLQTGKGLPNNSQAEKVNKNEKYDYLYMKALYHALPLEYVSITKLQSKLEGEANQATVRKLIEKMIEDGYIDSTPNRKLGKRVIHSEFTNNKFMEVKRALERNSMEIDGRSSEFKGVSIDPSGSNIRNGSTFGGLHSMGSDLTRTRVQSDIPHNASVRSGQTSLTKMQEKGNTPVSKPEPISSLESGVNRTGKERITDEIPREAEVSVYRRSSQDKRVKKVATVEEPIQYVKRQKLG